MKLPLNINNILKNSKSLGIKIFEKNVLKTFTGEIIEISIFYQNYTNDLKNYLR